MTTKEEKAPTAEDVERWSNRIQGLAVIELRPNDLARLRDLALLGVQVPGLRAELAKEEQSCADAMQERDTALEVIEQTAADLGCEQEWTNLHDHRQCLPEKVSALQARVEELTRERDEARRWEKTHRDASQVLEDAAMQATTERDALRVQVDAAETIASDVVLNGYGEDVEMLANRILSALSTLSTPPAEEKKPEPVKRSCNLHADCDMDAGPTSMCCHSDGCADHQ